MKLLIVCVVFGSVVLAQTRINLGNQASNVDFSGAAFTRPVKTGTGLPGSCMTGELFFRQDVEPGRNLYACTATNTWNALNGGGTLTTAVVTWNGVSGSITAGIGAEGSSPAWSGTVLNLPLASAPGVTAGLLSRSDYDTFAAKAGAIHTHPASDINSGTVSAARLGQGIATGETFLRGDGVWGSVPVPPFVKEFPAAVCQSAAGSLTLNAATATQPVADCAMGNNNLYGVAKFADSGLYALQGNFRLPNAVAALSLDIDWRTSVDAPNLGAVWQIQTACAADGESDNPVWNTPQTVRSSAKSVAGRIISATLSPVTLTGCGPDKRLFFSFYRDPFYAGDDLAGTAELIGLRFAVAR